MTVPTPSKMFVVVETLEDGKWQCKTPWKIEGPELFPWPPVFSPDEILTNSSLAATLNPAWKDLRVADRPEIFVESSLYTDTDALIHKFVDQVQATAVSVVKPEDLFLFPWEVPLNKDYRLCDRALEHFKMTGIIPSWAGKEGPHEISLTISSAELWGREWLYRSLPSLKKMCKGFSRIIFIFK